LWEACSAYTEADYDDPDPPESEQLDEREVEMLALLVSYSPEKRAQQIQQMDYQVGLAEVQFGDEDPRVEALRKLYYLCKDFCSELED
jgi:hypothetical protein